MTSMTELFEGSGTLRPDDGGAATPVPVQFSFVIRRTAHRPARLVDYCRSKTDKVLTVVPSGLLIT